MPFYSSAPSPGAPGMPRNSGANYPKAGGATPLPPGQAAPMQMGGGLQQGLGALQSFARPAAVGGQTPPPGGGGPAPGGAFTPDPSYKDPFADPGTWQQGVPADSQPGQPTPPGQPRGGKGGQPGVAAGMVPTARMGGQRLGAY